jgi:Cu/Ag efflux protein CusF
MKDLNMKKLLNAAFVAGAFLVPGAYAKEHQEPAPGATQPSAALSEGEVRKVDKDAQKITLRHGPLQNLDMPAMTMVFQVKDPAMLDQVKVGDKVKFQAEKIGGAFMLVQIEAAK